MSRFRQAPQDLFISTDIEADGPVPGLHSMLSLGSAAFTVEGDLIETFSANLETLPEATAHPETSRWWEQWPEAWEAARRDARPPEEAMRAYAAWLERLGGYPVFVAWPAGFDFAFVNYYLQRFVGSSPFRHTALDMKSYAMATLQHSSYRRTTKQRLPAEWFEPGLKHNHVALDDAIEQGALFMAMMRHNLQRGMPDLDDASFTEYPEG